MDLRSYLRAIRKRWWLVLLVVLLGAGGGIALNVRATPMYASEVRFYVSTPALTDAGALSADQFAQRRTNSYVELLSSERLAHEVILDAGLTLTPGQVMSEIKGSAQVNTVLLVATVTDPIPSRSLKLATSVASVFPRLIDELDNRGAKGATVVLNVVSGPTLHHTPVSPRKNLNITIGVLVGLLVGLLLAVLRELSDTTVRAAEVVRGTAGSPVIATIPFDGAAKKSPLIVGGQLHKPRAEAFRQLRTNLQFADVDHPVKVIVVTSSVVGEGKSTTATNLAVVFVETGRRVLLIEADLRRPRVSDYLGLERAVGLTNVLAGQVSIDEVLHQWGTEGLTVLPCGSIPPNPSELLGSQNMFDLIAAMRQRFDTIIIDTPPLLPVTDGAVASALSDGVVVVVRYGKTNRAQLAAAVRTLGSVDARILGCVLNMQPSKHAESRGRYDGYGYYKDASAPDSVLDLHALLHTGPDARTEHANDQKTPPGAAVGPIVDPKPESGTRPDAIGDHRQAVRGPRIRGRSRDAT